MSAPQIHPRRRPLKTADAHAPSLNMHGMQLRKSTTFSSPKQVSSDIADLDILQLMPRRSPTSSASLEDLVNDAGVQRVANILKDFDKKLAGHISSAASILNDPEVLPVPSLFLDNTSMRGPAVDPMDIDCKSPALDRSPHEHASDSGLGSSVSVSNYGDNRSVSTSASSSHSAVTRSATAASALEEKHMLGEYAFRQINDYIIKPILAEESLKDFHPLIKDVPRRIGQKSISNLRDLEKTLVFLAPEYSATPHSYLHFCERSVRLLQATVEYLPEQDQRLPTDRPYTNNYFLDLMEQIRRYAAIMAATRQKEANGEELDEMDYSRDEKITLRGGLARNGRPAQLVREKNGKVIPLSDDIHSKRGLSDDEMDDEGIMRSMARRRKSERPGDVMHTCRDCKKEFKRPCDLTKHEKTHSRPWKCTEAKCKYYDLGWPTEKERDRHVNDKHSAAPPQYKCLYPPCTYASKRESNCKQHMEKAHGWTYVRSKSNGRRKGPASSTNERSPPTPLTPFIGTPNVSTLTTPVTPFMMSPSVPLMGEYEYPYGFGTPAFGSHDMSNDYRRDSATTTEGSIYTYSSGQSPLEPTSFDNAIIPDDTTVNHNDILNCGLDTNFNTAFQQPTPAWSTEITNFEDFTVPMQGTANMGLPHLSPTAHPDVMLSASHMNVDEGFSEDMQSFRPTGDFDLFGSNQPMNFDSNTGFFPEIDQLGGQFGDNSLYAEPTMQFDDMMPMDNFHPTQ